MKKINADVEKLRLAALKEFQILDTLPEQEFDDITLLASQICETPIAAVTLVDEDRQWFKARVGLETSETPRACAFCDYAIEGENLLVVPDAKQDLRFAHNPLVTGEPHIRFYAGAPLVTSDGYKLGTLCVIDRQPRELSDGQQRALSALARSTMTLIEARNADGVGNNTAGTANSTTVHFSKIEGETLKEKTFFNRYLKPYLIATLIVAVITALKLFLDSVTQTESPFMLYAFAILLAAWRGGFSAGLYATLAAVVTINYFFLYPQRSLFDHGFSQYLLFLIFIGQGVLISALCDSRLRGEWLLYKAGRDLENRVAHRTAQLAQANGELKQEIEERSHLQEDLRQARDEAVESTRLKSEFLANMSHEIRTPMNGVIGMTGLLLETRLDDEQRRFAEVIRSSGESLLTIINDILDFSKVEAGKLELEMLDFDLRDTVESLVELFSSRAREQNNELAAHIYSDVPLHLRGDAGRIRQILTNLIGNAVKFTKRGNVVVRVKKVSETAADVRLHFSVTDTGEGISREVQTRLFQPFTQSDASTTRRYGGTGLGLSISKKLVELMNGEIGLESEIGKGSTFWFDITLEKQAEISTKNFASLNLPATANELSGKKVLIVDDNKVNREILAHQARSWKMEVGEACDGFEALTFWQTAAPPELIILDLQMPLLDGLETARRIRAAQSGQVRPSIILISSGGSKISEETMRELGIGAFLNKPYRQDDLLGAINQALDINRDEYFEETGIHITAIPETNKILPIEGFKPKRVLIVEDNSVNQMVAQNLLKNFGYRADVAANGREALQALEIAPYDLILMDCQMPEMDGYDAAREIRARDWQPARTPIIALTAHATGGEREKCLRAGMDDYLSKPIEKETLRRVLTHWLEKSVDDDESAQPNSPDENHLAESAENISSVAAVDLATLDDITDNDTEMRREVVEIYLSQTVGHLSEIEQAISANDSVKLYEIAHKTVGGSALCGMTAIVEPLRKLEQLGREGNTGEAFPYFAQAQDAFAAINQECRRILEN